MTAERLAGDETVQISLQCDRSKGELDHFWRSTGFTPAKLLLDPDMRQMLTYVGGIPNGGVEYVRMHYPLNLVGADGVETDDPTYDWTDLNNALDVLVENGLRPFFELMGYPSVTGYFTDFQDDEQIRAWKRFVVDLATHLEDRYGRGEVESWYFETWNEPDIPAHWDRFGFAVEHESFCNYYDACSEGLLAVNENLRMGGPGTARTLSPLFKSFVAHCDDGENYFTGERGVRLDFVSVHEKGASPHREDVTPDTQGIIDREMKAYTYLAENHPDLADRPMMNNECDPHTGWVDTHTWRAKPYYAALAAKIVDQHLDQVVDESDYEFQILSNDNGFLGTWGQRTLMTRFGEGGFERGTLDPNRAPERERIDSFELVKKPIFNLMTLLSLLGDTRIDVEHDTGTDDIHVIPTKREDPEQIAVVVSHVRDEITAAGATELKFEFTDVPFSEGVLALYRIDSDHANPYDQWEIQGAPDRPSVSQFEELRGEHNVAGTADVETVSVTEGALQRSVELPRPGVVLALLSEKPNDPPGRVTGLRAEQYHGLDRVEDDVILAWEDLPSRTLKRYEVLYASDPDGPFERVNDVDILTSAYLHPRPPASELPNETGYYAIRAVDYWGRSGERSDIVSV